MLHKKFVIVTYFSMKYILLQRIRSLLILLAPSLSPQGRGTVRVLAHCQWHFSKVKLKKYGSYFFLALRTVCDSARTSKNN